MIDGILRFFQNIPDDFVRYSDRSLPHMSLVYEKTHERDGYYYGVLLYPNGPIAIKYGGQYFRFLKLSGIISSWLETNMPGHKILLDFGNKSHQLIS